MRSAARRANRIDLTKGRTRYGGRPECWANDFIIEMGWLKMPQVGRSLQTSRNLLESERPLFYGLSGDCALPLKRHVYILPHDRSFINKKVNENLLF